MKTVLIRIYFEIEIKVICCSNSPTAKSSLTTRHIVFIHHLAYALKPIVSAKLLN
jgi:hypothetical protein